MLLLLRARVRADRYQLTAWVLGAALLALATARAALTTYGDPQQRATLVEAVVATPALRAVRGLPDGSSAGAFAFLADFTYLALLAGLMSALLVVRHTRRDEESGRTELALAARTTPLLATLAHALLADVVLGLAVALALVAGGLPVPGSVLTGAATAAVGWAFAGCAAVAAQLAPSGRSADALAAGVVGAAFALRAAGDALGRPTGQTVVSAWPSRLSPIGWGQAVQAYSHPTWWPLLPCIGLLLAAAGTAGLVASRRDLGASLLRARPGPATGTTTTALGLAWRLHRSTLLGWGLGAALLGLFAGGLASTATDALGDTAQARRLLASVAPGGRGGLVDLFVTAVVGFGGLLAAAAGSQALVRARSDQVDGRADLVLAAPITRARWLLDWVLVGAACSSTVAVGTGVVAGAAFRAAGEPRFWTSVEVGLAQLPAALVLVGAAALLLVLVPRVSGALTWAVLALAMTLGQLGGLLGLPERVRATSPFAHTPALPFTASDAGPVAGLLLAALALTAAALTAAAWMPGRGAGPRAGPRANRRATGHRPTAVRR